MNNLFKPASFLMYFLAIIVFFVFGMSIAGISGVADGQGLAGGAIIFFYGMVSAVVALIASLILAYQGKLSRIISINKILGVLLLIAACFLTYKVISKDKKEEPLKEYPTKTRPVTQESPN